MSLVTNAAPVLLQPARCLPGRSSPIQRAPTGDTKHIVTKHALMGPIPDGFELATFGMGCFWCSEGHFCSLAKSSPGIHITRVGYSQGVTPNPTYEEISSGQTNHVEVVQVVYDPSVKSYSSLLKDFWELHDPTTLMKQGNDVGTQYRSGIYWSTEEQRKLAEKSRQIYQESLNEKRGNGTIVTEIEPLRNFYIAAEYHQQYELKPGSRAYCGMRPTGVEFNEGEL